MDEEGDKFIMIKFKAIGANLVSQKMRGKWEKDKFSQLRNLKN